ncbi:MAG: hypothetical protein ACI84D_003690 [Thalassolituus oleivorans]|jgi:hypothetical protein
MSLEGLKSSCTHYNGRRLWLGRIALRSRVLDVRGWRGGRLFRDKVRLEDVSYVARGNDGEGGNLILGLHDGGERTLSVTAPGIWRMQIDYRLRRIGSVKDPTPDSPVEDSRDLPTADELEVVSAESSAQAPESLDVAFFEDVGSWPIFEEDQSPGIGVVAMEPDEEEVGFSIEPILLEDHAPAEIGLSFDEPAPEQPDRSLIDALQMDAPDAETQADHMAGAAQGLHEIGDDQVSDQVMDASSHETVVLDWLQPAEEAPYGVRFTPVPAEAARSQVGGASPLDSTAEAPVESSAPVAVTDPDRDIGLEEDWVGDLTVFEGVVAVAESGIGIALDSDVGDEERLPEVELVAEAEVHLDLEPVEVVAEADVDVEVEPVELALEADLVAEPEVELVAEAEAAVDPTVEPEIEAVATPIDPPAEKITIASRPFQHSKVYQARPAPESDPLEEPEELAAEPVAQAESEPVAPAEPAPAADKNAPARDKISIEPAVRRDRLPIESMVHLRPVSLADLIKDAEPVWTPLAEID